MADAQHDLPLAAEFPAATREQWRKLVDGVLKGAPFEKRLVARTYDGLAIEPLYARAPMAVPVAGRAPGAPWQVMQRVDHPDPAAANAEALHELENGATGLALVFAGAVGAYGYGLDASEATIARVLDGVHLDAGIALDLDLSPQTKDAARADRRAGQAARHRPGRDSISASASIRSARAAIGGGSPLSWDALAPIFDAVDCRSRGAGLPRAVRAADGRVVHNAGGSEAQELAFVLAVAVAYLRAFEAGGIALDAARGMISFRLAADADQFLTIAKFRALRKLWARVEESLRPCAEAGLRRRRDRVADDDAARPVREHAARRRSRRSRPASAAPMRSRCCRSPRRSACPTASRGGSRATPSLSCSRKRTSPRSPTRRPAPAGSRT